ncbi:MAG: N-acetyltransferase [Vulcanibacillus sp.]
MKHIKTCCRFKINNREEEIDVYGPVGKDDLLKYQLDKDLNMFRQSTLQQKALVEISESSEGRIIIAKNSKNIIGYVTYHFPDRLERWSEAGIDNLLELGAIEVVSRYRRYNIAQNLLKVSMMDDSVEDYIIIATNYYWHWDLKETGLNVYDYRKVINKVMHAGGLEYMPTDDPDICVHPANCLTVRIGKRVSFEDIEKFERVRLKNQFMY